MSSPSNLTFEVFFLQLDLGPLVLVKAEHPYLSEYLIELAHPSNIYDFVANAIGRMICSSLRRRGVFFDSVPLLIFDIEEETFIGKTLDAFHTSKDQEAITPMIVDNNTSVTTSRITRILLPLPVARKYPQLLFSTRCIVTIPTTIQANFIFGRDIH
jgi:hypothetical protein